MGQPSPAGGGARRYLTSTMLLLICFILGFGLTVQLRSVYRSSTAGGTELKRADDLQQQLNETTSKNAALLNQVNSLQKSLNAYQNQSTQSGDREKLLQQQLEDAQITAGLQDVQGPGVVVTMDDGTGQTQGNAGGTSANAFIIHDTDILQVLNELRDAGVEALSLNDERILATTEVRCAGNTVSVNNDRTSTPFVIRAVGNPDKLKSALLMKNGIVDNLSQWGIHVAVEENSKIRIKAYAGTPVYKYAKAAKDGAGTGK